MILYMGIQALFDTPRSWFFGKLFIAFKLWAASLYFGGARLSDRNDKIGEYINWTTGIYLVFDIVVMGNNQINKKRMDAMAEFLLGIAGVGMCLLGADFTSGVQAGLGQIIGSSNPDNKHLRLAFLALTGLHLINGWMGFYGNGLEYLIEGFEGDGDLMEAAADQPLGY